MQTKSPFIIVDDFLSPLECEDAIARLGDTLPNTNHEGYPVKSVKENKLSEIRFLPYLKELMPQIEEYYNFEYYGTKPFDFEWYPQDCVREEPRCENSLYNKGKWTKKNGNDFCAVVFLNDYQEKPPFDGDFEVCGGKLSFPNHDFSFNPQRGMLVMFPGNQNFINFTTSPVAGDAHQIRIQIMADPAKPFVYDRNNFKGTYKDWFPDK